MACKMKNAVLVLLFVLPLALADLRVGFYSSTCPQAESIVRQVVQKRFGTERSITAALLRMHFHDCFVRVSYLPFTPHEYVTLKCYQSRKMTRLTR